jgi:hypothetical protein
MLVTPAKARKHSDTDQHITPAMSSIAVPMLGFAADHYLTETLRTLYTVRRLSRRLCQSFRIADPVAFITENNPFGNRKTP